MLSATLPCWTPSLSPTPAILTLCLSQPPSLHLGRGLYRTELTVPYKLRGTCWTWHHQFPVGCLSQLPSSIIAQMSLIQGCPTLDIGAPLCLPTSNDEGCGPCSRTSCQLCPALHPQYRLSRSCPLLGARMAPILSSQPTSSPAPSNKAWS